MIYHDVVVRFPSAASHLIVHCLSSSMYRCTHMHIHCTSIAHPFIGTCKQTDIDQQTHRYSKEQMHCTWNTSTLHSTAWHRSASHNMTLLCLAHTALICIAFLVSMIELPQSSKVSFWTGHNTQHATPHKVSCFPTTSSISMISARARQTFTKYLRAPKLWV